MYIYDKRGLEVHCLREHLEPRALAFLRHFFLLASIGDQGVLRYQARPPLALPRGPCSGPAAQGKDSSRQASRGTGAPLKTRSPP